MTDTDKLTDKLTELGLSVEALREGDEWRRYMAAMARLGTYSPTNQLLIYMQWEQRRIEDPSLPALRTVAGFGTWKKHDRWVRKGEKGIHIVAPIKKKLLDNDGEWKLKVVGFRGAYVFELAQTDGRPIALTWPTAQPAPVWMFPILGSVVRQHFEVPIHMHDYDDECRGHYDRTTGEIYLSRTLDVTNKATTLLHEVAHHIDLQRDHEGDTRARRELVAESAAAICAQRIGIDCADETTFYLASWDGSVADLVEVSHRIGRCVDAMQPLVAAALSHAAARQEIAA